MYSKYFIGYDIKPEFNKEFISIFDGWLGEGNLHKLDEVTEKQWDKFNILVNLIFGKYQLFIPDNNKSTCSRADDVKSITSTYQEAMDKDSSQFTKIIIPEINSVLTEDWDYTYILWYKNDGALEALAPLIKQAGLFQFNG